MQMSFGTFSCPHAFHFPYFCNAFFFFFLQFILRFARLCCGLVPALGLALSHSNGGLIKHKPKSSDDDDDSCNCRWHFTLGQYARHAECRHERETEREEWLWAWVLSPARCFYEKFLSDKFVFFSFFLSLLLLNLSLFVAAFYWPTALANVHLTTH